MGERIAVVERTAIRTAVVNRGPAGPPGSGGGGSHTHPISEITDLQSALDAKATEADLEAEAVARVAGDAALEGRVESLEAAPPAHTHSVGEVTGLQTALDGKAETEHTHAIADTTGLQGALDGKAATAHTHAIGDTTGLQSALDAKASQAALDAVEQASIDADAGLDGRLGAVEAGLAVDLCVVTRASDQTISSNLTTFTNIAWTAEIEDATEMHDTVTNNDRIHILRDGVYSIDVSLEWASSNTGVRRARLTRVSGSSEIIAWASQQAVQGAGHQMILSTTRRFAAGDYILVQVAQSSGGNLALNFISGNEYAPVCAVARIGS